MVPYRIETKYLVRDSLFVKNILCANFRADDEHPFNYIFTLHFDTYDLDSYYDKLNGEYHKSKLRLRWYSDNAQVFMPPKAYMENKVKNKHQGLKYRVEVMLTDEHWKNIFDITRWVGLIEKNKPHLKIQTGKLMLPVMLSCYRRYRFEDSFSGIRISLDDNIHACRLSPLLTRQYQAYPKLRESVLEIKGTRQYLPPCLEWTGIFQLSSFSKYERLLTQNMGIKNG